jgi:hypothetical protein
MKRCSSFVLVVLLRERSPERAHGRSQRLREQLRFVPGRRNPNEDLRLRPADLRGLERRPEDWQRLELARKRPRVGDPAPGLRAAREAVRGDGREPELAMPALPRQPLVLTTRPQPRAPVPGREPRELGDEAGQLFL